MVTIIVESVDVFCDSCGSLWAVEDVKDITTDCPVCGRRGMVSTLDIVKGL